MSETAMPREQRAFVIATCAVIAGCFAYAACDWGKWAHVAYLPMRGTLAMGSMFSGIAMHWYGYVLWGIGGLATGALLGAGLCRVMNRPWATSSLRLLGAWAITALLLAGGYYTWSLWPFGN